jgi:hypothetical protein
MVQGLFDAGKNGLTCDTQRDATSDEVCRLKEENASLKTAVAEAILENQKLKKKFGPVVRERYQRMIAESRLEGITCG